MTDFLVLLANIGGFAGAILLALPFFREHNLKALLHDLRHPPKGRGGTAEVFAEAARHTAERLRRFEPRDQMWILAGLACLGASYLIDIAVWFAGALATVGG